VGGLILFWLEGNTTQRFREFEQLLVRSIPFPTGNPTNDPAKDRMLAAIIFEDCGNLL
jgi:hypothetical protein